MDTDKKTGHAKLSVANRVIFNTGVLYFQLIIGIAISFLTTRIVLNALGETDYGIYMLVAGIVGMLGILNSNMSNTSMRYMAHSLGTANKETILKTFNTTLFLHFIIGFIVIFLMEIGGWLMFEFLLNIPQEKIYDAKVIFHFMVLTTFITVISVPYDAVMNAHENMMALALVNVLGSSLNLGVAIYLTYSETNLLILYGFLMLVIQILLRIIKQCYSKLKYTECKIKFKNYVEKKLLKEIFSFSMWNLLNSISALTIVQVKGIFLNMFYGVALNAADGVARQATTGVNMLAVNMTNALNPQVMKSEGGGNSQRRIYLTGLATKFTVFLFTIIAIPLFFEAPYILSIWLKSVPAYAVIFFQLILIAYTFEKFTFEITTSIRAVGNIKKFQIIETSVLLLNIPVYYLVLKMGYPPCSIYITSIIISLMGACVRLHFGKIIAGIDINSYIKTIVFPVLLPVILTIIFAFLPTLILNESALRLFITLFVSIIIMVSTFWFWGLNTIEKVKISQMVKPQISKVFSSGN